MNIDSLPPSIRRLVEGRPYTENTTGMSGASVLIFPDLVLKSFRPNALTEGTVQMLGWLQGRLPAPRVEAYENTGETAFLLMSRIPGKMACDKEYLNAPDRLVSLLAQAIHMLWQVDISDCPRSRSLDSELAHARYSLENGLVDVDNMEKDTLGPGGFENPEQLLRWLENNKPPLEQAFSHGDCCLPNIFFSGDRVSGFIDLGDSGVADKWRDLALCYRSLKHNTDGTYGPVVPGLRPERLFDALGIVPDWDKLRYYILLDEFF
ncbi:MAG: aminoglycoside 3'-phosphotransferase [Clostridia bacterium]|nr:aminoglycoside 3'-phosphotransferase [Clostridia bacterium]